MLSNDLDRRVFLFIITKNETEALELENRAAALGFGVVGMAGSLDAGLEAAERTKPDLILVDLSLAGSASNDLSGLTAVRSGECTIIYLIGPGDETALGGLDYSRYFGCLYKPFQDFELSAAIEAARRFNAAGRERIGNDELLRAGQDRFRYMAENASDLVWTTDLSLNMTYISPAVEKLRGASPLEALARGMDALMTPESRNLVKKTLAGLLENNDYSGRLPANGTVVLDYYRSGGLIAWMECNLSLMRDENGEPVELLGANRDVTYQRRTEMALKESERKYRGLFNNAQVGLFRTRVSDGKPLEINLRYAQLAGYETVEECLIDFKAGESYVDPEVRKQILAELGERGEVRGNEAEIRRADGQHIWILFSAKLDSGKQSIDGALIDITDKKMAEEALKASEARFRRLIEHASIPLAFASLDNTRFFFNRKFSQVFGYDEGDLKDIRYWWRSAYPDKDYRREVLKQWTADVERALADGVDINPFEYTVTCRNGEKRIVEISGIPIDDNLLVTFFDVTERKRASRDLQRIFDLSLDLICIADIDSVRFLKVNPAFTATLGFSEEELLNASFMDFIHPDDVTPTMEKVERHLRMGRKVVNFENRYRTRQGEYRWLSWVSHPIPEEGLTFAVAHDLTEAKRGEEEQERLKAQLEQAQKLEAVGTLAGGVAHDFNNLLQAISGYTQIMLFDKTETDSDYAALRSIQAASERAADLVKQLLLFSRKIDVSKKNINLNLIVVEAAGILERTIPKMITLEIHAAEDLWTVNADPVQLEQIILNLGSNAADAMPDGGRLMIETVNIVLNDDYVQSHFEAEPGRYVLLTVSDDGLGIDKETLNHIFEPFYTTKEVGKGTGLGLASVYGIVKSHGGSISCYSELGTGTVFKIYLPALNKEVVDRDDRADLLPQRGSETILAVDDEEFVRDILVRSLPLFGYTVLTASSGEEALEIYKSLGPKIDLVIMDIGMPGMGGYRCLDEILKLNPEARVIVASGYSVNGQLRQALESGALGYVGKPYQIKVLLKKMRSILDGAREEQD